MKYKSIMYLIKKKGGIIYGKQKRCNIINRSITITSTNRSNTKSRFIWNSSIIRRIVTPLAIDEFNGPRGEFYKNMFAKTI